jgi:acyl-coenzyme A synthetase/AMP-(fatty) acid ligase
MTLCTVDDLIRLRSQDVTQPPVVALPASEYGLLDFEELTGRDLDVFTDAAANALMSHGLLPSVSKCASFTLISSIPFGCYCISCLPDMLICRLQVNCPATVVALLGPSTTDYLITMLGLSRLGYAILILSPRLAVEACTQLLQTAGAINIIYHPSQRRVVDAVIHATNIMSTPLLNRHEYDRPDSTAIDQFVLAIDRHVAGDRVAYIMHSSGSTGLPKLIHQTHKACLETWEFGWGARAFTTAPIYHNYGHSTFFRSIFTRGMLFMYNANLPATSQNLIEVMQNVQPAVFFAVPYILKLISESPVGLEALRACNVVNTAGSACPDSLGNLLTDYGVHYVTSLGL